jgi:hypothetical protein
VKQHILMGGDRTLNGALNQALELETAAWPTPRLREVTRVHTGRPPTPPERRRNERPVFWRCGQPGHFRRYCRDRQKRWTRTRELGGGHLSHQTHPLASHLRC